MMISDKPCISRMPAYPGGYKLFPSCIVQGCLDTLVQASNCKFSLDLGLCSDVEGACVTQNVHQSSFLKCEFNNLACTSLMHNTHAMDILIKGPNTPVCVLASWGKVTFEDCKNDGMSLWVRPQ